jgi:hypothetical protein
VSVPRPLPADGEVQQDTALTVSNTSGLRLSDLRRLLDAANSSPLTEDALVIGSGGVLSWLQVGGRP